MILSLSIFSLSGSCFSFLLPRYIYNISQRKEESMADKNTLLTFPNSIQINCNDRYPFVCPRRFIKNAPIFPNVKALHCSTPNRKLI
ncbi:hypothetical protein HDV63DRAFT_384968 [Trichoderma sp. SZMC 28014]